MEKLCKIRNLKMHLDQMLENIHLYAHMHIDSPTPNTHVDTHTHTNTMGWELYFVPWPIFSSIFLARTSCQFNSLPHLKMCKSD